MPIALGLRGLGVGPSHDVDYLLRDLFTTAIAAGNIDGTAAEPGPGTRQVEADTGNNLAITGGRIVASGIVGAEDPKFGYDDAIARVPGRTFKYTIKYITNRSHSGVLGAPGNPTPHYGIYEYSAFLCVIPPAQSGYVSFTTGADYTLWITLLASGAAIWAQGGAGSYQYTNPTLLFVTNYQSVDPVYLYPIIARLVDCSIEVDNVEVMDEIRLGTRQKLATVYVPSPAHGVGYTSLADALHRLTLSLPGSPGGGDTVGIRYRIQDASNYWHAYLEWDGLEWDFKLDKVVSDIPANQIAANGVGTPDEIFVIVDGDDHWCFTAVSDAYTMRGSKITDNAFNTATEVGAWYDGGTMTLLESFAREWQL